MQFVYDVCISKWEFEGSDTILPLLQMFVIVCLARRAFYRFSEVCLGEGVSALCITVADKCYIAIINFFKGLIENNSEMYIKKIDCNTNKNLMIDSLILYKNRF